ncbi:MAG: hypothetical protein COW48_00645 [Hydrogenophilales bacterium CG17_big_fil_post_rev_8_21_14_2_50_63_12]|nr:MAG: hypothetical protein COW48_00645 [Hydrogenophilales bacterium CG17_big_fil_post_rev_8_21_14_2_50_63_12]PIX96716.1 MAG: hypothetical protein COZ24_09165 [Hydrogenophilales bacterium CG_4_10_14_3_um_filter_63_21]PJB02522.1 MAG: hypothetical protein CO126_11570 [Hydrogenophilales bacterium CG_4_9_14_3_um_filter_63_34]
MTPRQLDYIQHRAAGMQPTKAAIAAGYAEASAAVTASRMEHRQDVREAIEAARGAAAPATAAPPAEFQDAEGYLQAVVLGTTPADPVRVSAARTLIQYQTARQRAPVASPPPRQLAQSEEIADESAARKAWAMKSAQVRARLSRAK